MHALLLEATPHLYNYVQNLDSSPDRRTLFGYRAASSGDDVTIENALGLHVGVQVSSSTYAALLKKFNTNDLDNFYSL